MAHTARSVSPKRRKVLAWLFAMLLVPLFAVAVMPGTVARAAGPTEFANTTAITTTDSTTAPFPSAANPFPSTIAVSGMSGLITDVTVTLHGVNGTTANDLDALLVSPSGANLVVMSDIGLSNSFVTANNATITLSDAGAAFPTKAGAEISSGTYAPLDNDAGLPADDFLTAPTPSSNTTLAAAFAGSSANGTWSLYVVDDTSGDAISISGGWSLSITTAEAAAATTTSLTSSANPSMLARSVTFTATVTSGGEAVTAGTVIFTVDGQSLATVPVNGSGVAEWMTSGLSEGTHQVTARYGGATGFAASSDSLTQVVDRTTSVSGTSYCNTGPITIPAQGTASVYPSRLTVSNLSGSIADLQVRLLGLSHSSIADLDVLLVGPDDTHNLILLSDAGGVSAASDVDLTFSDAAGSTVADPVVTGTYQPTNDPGADAFPGAPTPSSATTLATFDGDSADGTWSLYVVDDASADAGSIADGWCVDLTMAHPTTTSLSASPAAPAYGQPVTVKATVTSGGDPVTQGSVKFSFDGGTMGTVDVGADGTATFSVSTLPVGPHNVTADYTGSGTYEDSAAAPLSLTITAAPTTTTSSAAPQPGLVNDVVTITANVVARGDPVPEGSVTISVDGVPTVVSVNAGGKATLSYTPALPGSVTVTASYTDTQANYLDSSATPLTLSTDARPTTVVLTGPTGHVQYGHDVTLTATVKDGTVAVTSGTVRFTDGSTVLGEVPVVAGVATYTVVGADVGEHDVTATFLPTTTYAGSDDTLTVTIDRAATTTTVSANWSGIGDPFPGQNVTLLALVQAPVAGAYSGTVEWLDGGVVVGSAQLNSSGSAQLVTTTLPVGDHVLTARYLGNDVLAPSTTTHSFTVTIRAPLTTSVDLSADPDVPAPGEPVHYTATVTESGSPVGDGTVQLSIDGSPVGAPIAVTASGVAEFDISALDVGQHTVRADYSGVIGLAASHAEITQTVDPVADAGGPYSVTEGDGVTLDASGSTPGSVIGWDLNSDGDFTDAIGMAPTLTWAELESFGIDDGPATFLVSVRASYGGRTVTATVDLDVVNAAPTVYVDGDLTATVGVPFTIKVGADDPSSVDAGGMFDYVVDWGDGSPVLRVSGPADPPVTHTYATAGSYVARVTAADKDGGDGGGITITVAAQPAQGPSNSTEPTRTAQTTQTAQPTQSAGASQTTQAALPGTGATALMLPVGIAALALLGVGVAVVALDRRRGRRD